MLNRQSNPGVNVWQHWQSHEQWCFPEGAQQGIKLHSIADAVIHVQKQSSRTALWAHRQWSLCQTNHSSRISCTDSCGCSDVLTQTSRQQCQFSESLERLQPWRARGYNASVLLNGCSQKSLANHKQIQLRSKKVSLYRSSSLQSCICTVSTLLMYNGLTGKQVHYVQCLQDTEFLRRVRFNDFAYLVCNWQLWSGTFTYQGKQSLCKGGCEAQ